MTAVEKGSDWKLQEKRCRKDGKSKASWLEQTTNRKGFWVRSIVREDGGGTLAVMGISRSQHGRRRCSAERCEWLAPPGVVIRPLELQQVVRLQPAGLQETKQNKTKKQFEFSVTSSQENRRKIRSASYQQNM